MNTTVKNVFLAIASVIGFGLWIVACPDVEQHQQNGRCWETVKYAALVSVVHEVPC